MDGKNIICYGLKHCIFNSEDNVWTSGRMPPLLKAENHLSSDYIFHPIRLVFIELGFLDNGIRRISDKMRKS
jgi:hypothetical protein